jgi:hypothetical protein
MSEQGEPRWARVTNCALLLIAGVLLLACMAACVVAYQVGA